MNNPVAPPEMRLLAFDTSTERLSVALCSGGQVWAHNGAGGAAASALLLPAIQGLMAQAGLDWTDLRAIVFGRGPGSFTGLRTACSVAQGLAFGAALPLLAVDTLLAVAEDARQRHGCTRVWAVLDARMDQVYTAHYLHQDGRWTQLQAPSLANPQDLAEDMNSVLAGNAPAACAARLPQRMRHVAAWPEASAMLRLAPWLLEQGHAVPAEQAQPMYLRDKVAQTTAERASALAERAA